METRFFLGQNSKGHITFRPESNCHSATLEFDGMRKPRYIMHRCTQDQMHDIITEIDKEHGEYLARKESRKAMMATERNNSRQKILGEIKPGTLMHGSWGYEQTQCELFQVINVKGSTATLCRIASERVHGKCCHDSEYLMPIKDKFVGSPAKFRIGSYGIRYNSSCTLYPASWDKDYYHSWGY